ncbi:hypothetical protein ANRL3_02074 [Anaerolineae bacterium]|nr:hypothetical protein ANRL3_02074 [Anaerolineae bacterium]
MQTHRIAFSIGLVLLLTACVTPTPTAVPTPTATRITILGPTEENPILTYHFSVVDATKQTPVKVNSVKLGGKEIARDVSEFAIRLPGDTIDFPLLLQVKATGYQSWEQVFQHRVFRSRTVNMTLELLRQLARKSN